MRWRSSEPTAPTAAGAALAPREIRDNGDMRGAVDGVATLKQDLTGVPRSCVITSSKASSTYVVGWFHVRDNAFSS
jgi:hypothetical protein